MSPRRVLQPFCPPDHPFRSQSSLSFSGCVRKPPNPTGLTRKRLQRASTVGSNHQDETENKERTDEVVKIALAKDEFSETPFDCDNVREDSGHGGDLDTGEVENADMGISCRCVLGVRGSGFSSAPLQHSQ